MGKILTPFGDSSTINRDVLFLNGFLTRPEFVFVAGFPNDLVTGLPFTGGPATEVRELGQARISTAAGNLKLSRAQGKTQAQTEVTFVLVYTPRSGSVVNQQWIASSSGSSGFAISDSSSSSLTARITKQGVANLSGITVAQDVTYVLIASHNQVSGEYYITAKPLFGGATVTSTTANTAASLGGNGTYRAIGARDDIATPSADIYLAAMSFVFEPEAKMRALLTNPWQLFSRNTLQPIPTRLPKRNI